MSTDSPSAAPPTPEPPRFVKELDTLIRARYSLIYLVSWEEQRLDVILEDLARSHGKTLCSWSITSGLRKMVGSRWGAATDGSKDPGDALRAILALPDPSLVVLKDFHPFLNDPVVVRSLRELAHQLKTTYTTVILLSPLLNIPVELEKDVTVLDVPLPTFNDLGQLLREILATLRKTDEGKHAVDLVVTDEQGTQTGVKVDARTGEAAFVGHGEKAGALAHRVMQRYAYSRVLNDLKRKGYQIGKEEKQKDGSIRLVAQRWR